VPPGTPQTLRNKLGATGVRVDIATP
jgi:hypothetical protein